MVSYQVDILNPKADKLLQDLADLKLISLSQKSSSNSFLTVVNKLRKNAAKNPPTLDKITKEVEAVRSKKYAKKRKA